MAQTRAATAAQAKAAKDAKQAAIDRENAPYLPHISLMSRPYLPYISLHRAVICPVSPQAAIDRENAAMRERIKNTAARTDDDISDEAAGAARDEAGREPKAAPASGKKGFFGW